MTLNVSISPATSLLPTTKQAWRTATSLERSGRSIDQLDYKRNWHFCFKNTNQH
jgi:hypothetical protein